MLKPRKLYALGTCPVGFDNLRQGRCATRVKICRVLESVLQHHLHQAHGFLDTTRIAGLSSDLDNQKPGKSTFIGSFFWQGDRIRY